MSHKLYTDGGARNNPGPAGIGGVLFDDDNKLIAELSEYIGEGTNNQAEYEAIIAGLKLAIEHKIKKLDCYLDSKLVVEQVNKNWKIKEPHLQKLFVQVWNLTHKFDKVSFNHIRREKNTQADTLVNKALDKQLKS
jgi:ribonuclease HI